MTRDARYAAFEATDAGRVRENNEDLPYHNTVTNPNGLYHLWVVADGMGGGARGEVASREAVTSVQRYFDRNPSWFNPAETLREAFIAANRAVHEIGTGNGEATRSAMGTTLAAVLLHDQTGQFWWANVGDSRIYRAGPDGLDQLSHDHSLVAERVRAGLMRPAEARAAKNRNVLTRAIGIDASVEPEVSDVLELQSGEALVLATDGVHGMLNDGRLSRLLAAPISDEVAQEIVDAAVRAGGQDNATAVVGALASDFRRATARRPAAAPWWRRREALLGAVAAVVVAGAVGGVLALGGAFEGDASATDKTPTTIPTVAESTTATSIVTAHATVPPTAKPSASPTKTPEGSPPVMGALYTVPTPADPNAPPGCERFLRDAGFEDAQLPAALHAMRRLTTHINIDAPGMDVSSGCHHVQQGDQLFIPESSDLELPQYVPEPISMTRRMNATDTILAIEFKATDATHGFQIQVCPQDLSSRRNCPSTSTDWEPVTPIPDRSSSTYSTERPIKELEYTYCVRVRPTDKPDSASEPICEPFP